RAMWILLSSPLASAMEHLHAMPTTQPAQLSIADAQFASEPGRLCGQQRLGGDHPAQPDLRVHARSRLQSRHGRW
ncbi:hypothetical protein AN399_32480, partial [Pseudomonas aeruginosa]